MDNTYAYIGLGSNIGELKDNLNGALKMISEIAGVEFCSVSDFIETAPLGKINQPAYLNAVVKIETSLSAMELFSRLINIERSLGRQRREKWGPRIIDLDLLLYGDELIVTNELTVPHIQMHLRSFVLEGLCQLDANIKHATMGVCVGELLKRLNGCDFYLDVTKPQVMSIAGLIGVGKTMLSEKLANKLGCRRILESYDSNPYLPKVYAGQNELALDSQLYFLQSRTEQLNKSLLEAGKVVVSDYIFEKELIYAEKTLSGKQQELYKKRYELIGNDIVQPTVVVYLVDSVEKCLKRIHKRNRPYEQNIEPEFLNELNDGYESLFKKWNKCPVIRIDKSCFDCTRVKDVDNLTEQIKNYIVVK